MKQKKFFLISMLIILTIILSSPRYFALAQSETMPKRLVKDGNAKLDNTILNVSTQNVLSTAGYNGIPSEYSALQLATVDVTGYQFLPMVTVNNKNTYYWIYHKNNETHVKAQSPT